MDLGWVLGIILCLVGLTGLMINGFWLWTVSRGTTPEWFTKNTKRMPRGLQVAAASWMTMISVLLLFAGLTILLVPQARDATNALL